EHFYWDRLGGSGQYEVKRVHPRGRSERDPDGETWEGWVHEALGVVDVPDWPEDWRPSQDMVDLARAYVHYRGNMRLLEHVRPYVTFERGRSGSVLLLEPDSLKGALYVSLAREVLGNAGGARFCRQCGKLLPSERRADNLYCNERCQQRYFYHHNPKSPKF